MTRLLFLSERYQPDTGGVAASATRISKALAQLDCSVDVITWTRTQQSGVVAREGDNPRIHRIGRYRDWDTTMPHTMNLVDWLISAANYDAVWGHYINPAGFLSAWIGKLKNIPSIVSIRGNDLERDMFPPGDFARLEWTLQNATLIAAVTNDLKTKAAALTGRTDIVSLPNAVDHETFRPTSAVGVRKRLGIRPNEAVLGFLGELREKKGQQLLIDALRNVQETRPACLLIVGEIRPSELARLLPLIGPGTLEENRILVTGNLTAPLEVNLHLQICDVILQPSLWDGMPNAVLEAMSAGCGVIGSDAGGIPEIITGGVDGIIVPRWQLHRLGEAVIEWLDAGAEHQNEIRQAARRRVLENFSFEQERYQLHAVLNRVLQSR